jgi:hypothetical protein
MSADFWTWVVSASEFWGFAAAAFGGIISFRTIAYVTRLRHEARLYEAETERRVKLGKLELKKSQQQPSPELIELVRLRREIEQIRLAQQTGAAQPTLAEPSGSAAEQTRREREPGNTTEAPPEAIMETSRAIAAADDGSKAARAVEPPSSGRPASRRQPVPATAARGLGSRVPAPSPA